LIAAPLLAADAAAPKLYVLHQEVVRPSALKAYEETNHEFLAAFKQHRDMLPGFSFTTVAGEDFIYNFITPIPDFAYAGTIYDMVDKVGRTMGEAKWADLLKRNGATIDSMTDSVFLEDPSLSYAPANPRLKPQEELYFHFDFYYIQTGREAEADAVARDFAALFRARNMSDGYHLMKLVFGHDLPLLVVAEGFRDAADFAAQDVAMRKTLGAEGEALFARAFAITRKFDRRNGWVRPDLSMLPAGK
jgi:hypothetical protein